SSFAEDQDGEVYVTDLMGGAVYAMRRGTPISGTIPAKLSETGCVDPADPRRPADLVHYDVASPLYSDGATKERHLAVPRDAHIERRGDHLDLPPGGVAMKTFAVDGKRIETRLLVRHEDGEWAGYSYRWNDDETDAYLLSAGDTRVLARQTWTFPSR